MLILIAILSAFRLFYPQPSSSVFSNWKHSQNVEPKPFSTHDGRNIFDFHSVCQLILSSLFAFIFLVPFVH